ncbi:Uncharacterised protein [Mycobacteroides abscessus subsp. abscessus]|nr:Uncharacterised protein [Mycobacteroides abscessus subsp. abscessus]
MSPVESVPTTSSPTEAGSSSLFMTIGTRPGVVAGGSGVASVWPCWSRSSRWAVMTNSANAPIPMTGSREVSASVATLTNRERALRVSGARSPPDIATPSKPTSDWSISSSLGLRTVMSRPKRAYHGRVASALASSHQR